MQVLIWLLAAYGLIAAYMHISAWLYRVEPDVPLDVYLLTHNSEQNIEKYIRSLTHWAMLKGVNVRIFLIDEGSADDTLPIIKRFQKQGLLIEKLHIDKDAVGYSAVNGESTKSVLPPDQKENDVRTKVIDLRKRCFSCAYNTQSNQG